MAFSEAEKVQIRRYLGGTLLYIDQNPRLESAISTVETLTATEDYIRDDLLVQLAAIDVDLTSQHNKFIALSADEVKVDAVRAMYALRDEGWRVVGLLADAFGLSPFRNVYEGKTARPGQALGPVTRPFHQH